MKRASNHEMAGATSPNEFWKNIPFLVMLIVALPGEIVAPTEGRNPSRR